ncbi:MAG: hypothetical protein ACI4EI_11645 [Muricoprocola sp.]
MKNLDQYLDEQLQDDEFKNEWESIQPEMDVILAEGMGMTLKLEFVPKQL